MKLWFDLIIVFLFPLTFCPFFLSSLDKSRHETPGFAGRTARLLARKHETCHGMDKTREFCPSQGPGDLLDRG
jgi:hypothetical protein